MDAVEPGPDVSTRDLLNGQTARISWGDLQRYFAQGVLRKVSQEMDMLDVATAVVDNDKEKVGHWLAAGQLIAPTLDDARIWHREHAQFWAVVTSPG